MADPLVPSAPITISKSYNKLWISRITIIADSPKREAMAKLSLVPYVKETGELAPASFGFDITIPDIFQRIQGGDMELGSIFSQILAYASKEAKAQGKLT